MQNIHLGILEIVCPVPSAGQIDYLGSIRFKGITVGKVGAYRKISVETRYVHLEEPPYHIMKLSDGDETPSSYDGCKLLILVLERDYLLECQQLPFAVDGISPMYLVRLTSPQVVKNEDALMEIPAEAAGEENG